MYKCMRFFITKIEDGPDRIRTGDLTLRKRSHYPSYATSPKSLVNLRLIWIAITVQKLLPSLDFHPYCSDATTFDYALLDLKKPVFFIGGLAQMGGTQLASGVIDKVKSIYDLQEKTGWVFAGTYSQKYAPDPKNEAGWGTLIEKNNLHTIKTISLPTIWTFHENDETPYVFAQ